MNPTNALLGLIIFVFCVGFSISISDILTLSNDAENLIQLGFIGLGLACAFIGVLYE